jgi:16S rRNA (uracil1498-N3)-methyltransferase
MRLHRFYITQPLGEVVVISEVSLIKQWSKVFRYQIGDFVILFTGDGRDVTYEIQSISNKECSLKKINTALSYIPAKKVTLYLSIIKKDNFELVVQKATELGVSTIVPIISERSEKKNLNIERLHIIATEASEQCGRGNVPIITPIISLKEALEKVPAKSQSFILHMGGSEFLDTVKSSGDTGINLFIGPEGGWSDGELDIFKHNEITPVSLGKTVLRAETAAIVGCAYASLHYIKPYEH